LGFFTPMNVFACPRCGCGRRVEAAGIEAALEAYRENASERSRAFL
jgi:hypothetical protein